MAKESLARGELVEDCAHRVDISSNVNPAAVKPLGCQIRHRAGHLQRPGPVRLVRADRPEQPRQTEVENLQAPVRSQSKIARFEIPMNDATFMRRPEAMGELHTNVTNLGV